MKTTKRLLTMLLAVMLILTSFAVVPASAAFTDVPKGHNAYEAVDVLSKLGIINGYEEDGAFSFKPDNNVTRAEFAAMLLRTRGMGKVGSLSLENPPFPDVVTPDVSWAIGNIRTAKELGIINGYEEDGVFIFKPNNNVSYEEAVKMIVCALGYGDMNPEGAEWYSKYLVSATTLGFLKGVGGAVGTPATRATIAGMLYNCLEVKLAEDNQISDKTILKDDLKLTKNVGYIAATPTVSLLNAEPNLRDDEIQIVTNGETSVYKVENMDAYKDMLGAQITFYYTMGRDAAFRTLLMAQIDRSETIEITSDMIYGATANEIEYISAEGDRTIKASIDPDCVVVYNDKLYGETAETSKYRDYYEEKGSDAMPTIGSVKLLDRDADRKYDVAFIDSFEAWIVSSKTTSNYTIVDNILRKGMTGDNNKIVLDSDYISFYDLEGKESSFDAISTGNVLCIKRSNAENGTSVLITVIVCTKSVSGKVTGTSSKDGYTIAGKTYKASLQAPWENAIEGASPVTDAPKSGDSGKFYLDCNGNILAFEKTAAASNQKYGILIDAAEIKEGLKTSVQMEIITKESIKGKTYPLSKKAELIIGEDSYDYDEILDNLAMNGEVIKFTTNSKGEVEEIIVAEEVSEGQSIVAENLYKYTSEGSDQTYKYNSSNLISNDEKIYIGQAIMIRVPASRTNMSGYKTWSTSDFATDVDGYKVEFYDVTTTKSAKVVLVTEVPSSQTATEEIRPNSPVLVITESPELEGEDSYVLIGYSGKTANTRYVITEPDSETLEVLKELQIGDVVRIGGNSSDGYKIKPEYVLFGVESSSDRGAGLSYSFGKKYEEIAGQSSYSTIYGKAYQKPVEGDDRFMIDTRPASAGIVEVLKNKLSSAQIFIYDVEDMEFEAISDSFEQVYDSSYISYAEDGAGETASDVFIHEVNGTIKTMIIVKY